ncbi:MAG: redox-regulated ATPase YchF [Thermoanaerobaculia bacterium]
MGLSAGIVGLPNVGKSTIFNALTAAGAQSANYPFCTIEPNVGIVPVHDKRLDEVARLTGSKAIIYTDVKIVDIAGLVKGASKGEGLGNQFLANIRETDAIIHVVRCFEDANVVHVEGSVDPARDVDIIETELMLADLDTITKRADRVGRVAKSGQKEAVAEHGMLLKAQKVVEEGMPLRSAGFTDDEIELLRPSNLLTLKPVLYVANVAESDIGKETPHVESLRKVAAERKGEIVVLAGEIESQIVQLDEHEREHFLEDLGLEEPGLNTLVRSAYTLLNLETFFTAGPKEARAWTIHVGFKAPQAAGEIHTDFERGFIRAETIAYADFVAHGGEQGAKAAGKMRSEGKDYVVEDGDVILFRFNV